ncbi:MAG: hypothetical protein GY787_13440 [Alteromonadales bacterium]|nr:hypothetical protein [Alteromonadales bacterium]
MKNLTRLFTVIVTLTLIIACGNESTAGVVPTPEPKPKSFEISFDETSFEVQFDQSLMIPFTLIKDEGHSVAITLSVSPLLGEVIINDNSIEYTPSGELGEDTLTLSIADNQTTVKQKLEILVSDRAPHLLLSDPIYGLSTDLKDGVTVWGYNLGAQQDDSTIELCDLLGQCLKMPSIIHWKNSDANLPSTLEDLSTSHTIQEVKFLIPETSNGDKYILLKNLFGSTMLPFTVRPKTFEVAFDETNFEVQFDKLITIPLNITLDKGHSVITSLSDQPSLGEATIIDDKVYYVPSGPLGKDSLSISITDNIKTIEQELKFLVSDRAPHLAFSDLISGPSKGLGDKKGSGVIVTVWGFKLGETQNDSIIELCDLDNTCSEAAHVYYWKNADGELPSGPANLYESHGMQEIAFSIPDIGNGEKQIRVTNNYGTSTLPFTVRDGNIYHVATNGDNKKDCSFSMPCEYINGDINGGSQGGLGNGKLVAGDIVYSHGVQEPTFSGGGIEAGMFMRNVAGTEIAQVAIVAYPDPNNFSTITSAHRGLNNYLSEGIITSKYVISVGYADPTLPANAGNPAESNFHLSASRDGRGVGNLLTQKPNTCFTGWSGAIVSGAEGGQNYKAFGNHIRDLGCDNSSRYAHTLYMSIRNEGSIITKPWEIAYNYLDNNNVFYGIHNYDESYTGNCGTMTGTLKIHNNVIINQRGAGINIGTRDAANPKIACWGVDIEIINNVLINVGLGVVAEDGVANSGAIQVGGDLSGNKLVISNNTVYGHGDLHSIAADGGTKMISIGYAWSDPLVIMNNNLLVQTTDLPWIVSSETITGESNSFWSIPTNNANTPYPLDNNIIVDPKITILGSKIILETDSPLINMGTTAAFPLDIYGQKRGKTIGAVQK